jgi:ankyrin repeat protein
MAFAVRSGSVRVLQMLLDAGAPLTGGPLGYQLMLQTAAERDSGEALDFLARSNVRILTDSSLLRVAAQHHSLSVLHRLLDCGTNPNSPDSDGVTALMLACRAPRLRPHSLVHPTIDEQIGTVDALLDRGAVANALSRYWNTPITKEREDPETPLLNAVKSKQPRIVDLLLARGADPNYPQPADYAAALARFGAYQTRNTPCRTPLVEALVSADGEINAATSLLAHGARVDAALINGCGEILGTPLHYAARAGRLDLVETLLALGADPCVLTTWEGETALDWARKKTKNPTTKILSRRMPWFWSIRKHVLHRRHKHAFRAEMARRGWR